jgi:hypothetical protein
LIRLAALIGLALMGTGRGYTASLGKKCGTIAGIACDAGLWCEFPTGSCHVADAQGTCVPVAHVCALIFRPVCGCNGKTYGNDCMRRMNREVKLHDGKC